MRRGSSRQQSSRIGQGKVRSQSTDSSPSPLGPSKGEQRFQMGVQRVARPSPGMLVRVSGELRLAWKADELCVAQPIERDASLGAMLLPAGCAPVVPRELVIGLDFGTSATKVVITDRSLNSGLAVPLVNAVGSEEYLLPSALIETSAGMYALTGQGIRHADLKLAMLADMADSQACARVCAFLALVIRSARAWLFEAKRDQYLRSDILWALALGQPTEPVTANRYRRHFEDVASVAWSLAGRVGPIAVEDSLRQWWAREQLNVSDEVEVRVMPELSAQIHGFVSSSHFDSRQRNIYLMVDVGAGTVDASLFRVRKDPGGRVSFSLFTFAVEPLGTANLHRYRVDWWTRFLSAALERKYKFGTMTAERLSTLLHAIGLLRVPTEFRGVYPRAFSDYISGVELEFVGGFKSPDEEFKLSLLQQVAGQVMYGAWKKLLLRKEDVKGMPFFLCGGGARHDFYAGLKQDLQKTPNCSWLSATYRALSLPANLEAPGVAVADYDRLSVAYGLSQLNPGSFNHVSALKPKVESEKPHDWISSTVDKSAC